jgi:hypothetical protein
LTKQKLYCLFVLVQPFANIASTSIQSLRIFGFSQFAIEKNRTLKGAMFTTADFEDSLGTDLGEPKGNCGELRLGQKSQKAIYIFGPVL